MVDATLACSLLAGVSKPKVFWGVDSSAARPGRVALANVKKSDIVFPADKKPQPPIFFFDADTAARIINAAVYPYKLMLLTAAVCGLRIGEVTILKVTSNGSSSRSPEHWTTPLERKAPRRVPIAQRQSACPNCSRNTTSRTWTAISSPTPRASLT